MSFGRFDLAGEVFATALEVLESPQQTVSHEARVALYLSYGAATVAGGNLEQGLAAYEEASNLAGLIAVSASTSGMSKALARVNAIVRAAAASHTFAIIQQSRVSYTTFIRLHCC